MSGEPDSPNSSGAESLRNSPTNRFPPQFETYRKSEARLILGILASGLVVAVLALAASYTDDEKFMSLDVGSVGQCEPH